MPGLNCPLRLADAIRAACDLKLLTMRPLIELLWRKSTEFAPPSQGSAKLTRFSIIAAEVRTLDVMQNVVSVLIVEDVRVWVISPPALKVLMGV